MIKSQIKPAQIIPNKLIISFLKESHEHLSPIPFRKINKIIREGKAGNASMNVLSCFNKTTINNLPTV